MPSNETRPTSAADTQAAQQKHLSQSADTSRAITAARRAKFFSYYKPHLPVLAADLACAFLVALTTLALPLCANFIVDQLASETDHGLIYDQIFLVGGLMLALITSEALGRLFVDYQGHVMGARMETDMREELFAHYQKLSFSFYDKQRVGQLMSRISNDLFNLSELFHHGPEDIAIALLKLTGAMAILFYLSPSIALIILVSLPFAVAYSLYFNRHMGIAVRKSREKIASINEHVEDSLAGVRVVQAFGGEQQELERFGQENIRFLETRRLGYRAEALFSAGVQTYAQLLTLMVIVFGAIGILRTELSVADLMTYLLCIAILVDPISRVANLARLWQEGITGFHRFMEVLEIAPEIVDQPDAIELNGVQGRVEFIDVRFRYSPELSDVLTGVNLTIEAGEFVALVGASGVGKSTLCALVSRFYEPTQGRVLLDGHDVRTLRLRSLRKHIALVQQDVYLFAGTVLENIGYGSRNASRADIIQAAKLAHADEFISALRHGYDTDIGERGVQLSGGQKQRLTIARAFLRDPAVLIFDEATSALDGESERAVQAALAEIAKDRTTIVIAHRLSTIRHADRIVVLNEAGICEEGTHDDLLAKQGVYHRMHHTDASV
ncbi:MAG: ABC transporter ATP-binding protein [Pseudomonadales bacterium]|nr:ABC transporter ATP-binding protein [Pseudomonadales bacterium]